MNIPVFARILLFCHFSKFFQKCSSLTDSRWKKNKKKITLSYFFSTPWHSLQIAIHSLKGEKKWFYAYGTNTELFWIWCIQQPKVIKIPPSFYMIYDFLFCLLLLLGVERFLLYACLFHLFCSFYIINKSLVRRKVNVETVQEMELERYAEMKALGSL